MYFMYVAMTALDKTERKSGSPFVLYSSPVAVFFALRKLRLGENLETDEFTQLVNSHGRTTGLGPKPCVSVSKVIFF